MTEASKVQSVSSSLSADAPVFTPGGYSKQTVGGVSENEGQVGGVPLTEVPGYITSCYPFVQPESGMGRGSNKWNMPGMSRGRGTGRPFSGRGGKTRRGGLPNNFPGQQWTPNYQMNSGYVPQSVPGMTFDGGTVMGMGDGLLPTPVYPQGCLQPGMNGFNNNYGMYGMSSVHQQLSPNASWNNFQKPHRFHSNSKINMQHIDAMSSPDSMRLQGKSWSSGNSYINSFDDSKSRGRPRTIICKDISVQTDFSDELASLTLAEKPNALFSWSHSRRRKEKCKTNSNVVTYTSDSEVDSDSGYSSPLHRRNVRSNGTDPVGTLLPSTQPPEAERGRNILGRNHSNLSPQIGQQITYAAIAQQKPVPRRTLNYEEGTECGFSTQICDSSTIASHASDSVIPVGDDCDAQQGTQIEGGKKKRRRRNRRRKKKNQDDERQSDGLSATGRTFSSSNVSRTSDVTLHFEDESEFPDLYQSNVDSGHERDLDTLSRHTPISFSQIVKSSPSSHVSRCSSRQSDDFDLSREQTGDENTDNWQDPMQETKTARKRRKRREQANKAAEAELAEIGLEQQMLKELSLKQGSGNNSQDGSKSGGGKTQKSSKQGGIISDPAVVQDAKASKEGGGGGGGKKSKQPIAFDIGAMITALEKKKESTDDSKKALAKKKEEKIIKGPVNILDSSAPAKRGKERENPKPKKPSPLKKVILKEREQKKKMRLLDDDNDRNGMHIAEAPVGIGVANAESDLSQDGLSSKSSMELGNGASTSADLSPISQNSPISMSPLSPGASPLSSGVNSPITGHNKEAPVAVLKIHSRRFREYCNQVLDKDIDMCCQEFLQDLVRFQDRMFHKDPVKAKARRRIVLGLREVTKHLKLKKIKCVIISPNLEKIQSKGGLDDALNNILNMCQEQDIPFVFALGRRALGRACAKLVPVSCAGVFNYDGCEDTFKKLMDYTEKARQAYNEMVVSIEKELEEYPQRTTPGIFAHMGHSRTPSGCSVMSFTSSILSEPISENYPHSEPETDNRGYEIVKDPPVHVPDLCPPDVGIPSGNYTAPVDDIDDGNEADTEDFADLPPKVATSVAVEDTKDEEVEEVDEGVSEDEYDDDESSESDGDTASSQHASDTVDELPHIDSIHTGNYDLSTEILSQHSGRTLDRSEVMSTHSSRTLGDGSSTIMTEMIGMERSKSDVTKTCESPVEAPPQRLKLSDKDRIQNWVDSSNTNLSGLDENSDIDAVHSGSVTESENESECQGYVKGQTLKPICEKGEMDL